MILRAVVGAVVLATALTHHAGPTTAMTGGETFQSSIADWTDAAGVPCFSDEDVSQSDWEADKFTGTFTPSAAGRLSGVAPVYLCPWNANAPSGPLDMDFVARLGWRSGSASMTVTYPDGTVVDARSDAVTGQVEVCVVKDFLDRQPGRYIVTVTAVKAGSLVLTLDVAMTRPPLDTGGQFGCDPSWWQ